MSTDVGMTAFQERLGALEKDIARLSVSDYGLAEFFRLYLERMVAVLGEGGAIWQVADDGSLANICHINLAVAGLEEQGRQFQLLNNALRKVIQTAGSVVLPAHAGSNVFDGGLGETAVNDSPYTLLFLPIISTEKVSAVLLLISPTDVDPRAVRGYLGFVQGLCERPRVFLQGRRIKDMEKQLAQSDRLRQFISALHTTLDPRRTCYALANYAQELLGVYRCMAGTYSSRGKFRMEAVSGVESIAVKSSFIKSISEIARVVCRNDKILLVDNPNAAMKANHDESDDLLTAARLYMLQAGSLVLGVFPIKWDKQVVGTLVVEKVSEETIDQLQRRKIEGLLMETGSALSNSLTYRHLPFSPLVRLYGALRDRIYRMARLRRGIWTAVLLVILLTPFLVKKQVKVIGSAQLVPIDARIAYVEQDGVIETVFVETGQKVQKGAVLAVLDKRIIASEIDRVTDAISEANMAFLQAQEAGLITLAQQYKHKLAALHSEREKYLLQRDQYEIIAPVTGSVITRESEIRQLQSKPVTRGEPVLEVVPDDSLWQFLVNIPEDSSGQLLQAYDKLEPGQTLPAKIILKMYPRITFRASVLSVARSAYVLSTGPQKYRNVIEVRVGQPDDLQEKIDPRQGMEGKVAIECGRRSLFFVVTHEFVDFIRVSMF